MSEYIDRDLALSHPYANGKYDKEHANIAFITGFESYKEWLEILPKADVRENIQGKWIDFPDDRVQCSECNVRYPRFHRANFCDNCGADMREFLKNKGHRYDILKGESWG